LKISSSKLIHIIICIVLFIHITIACDESPGSNTNDIEPEPIPIEQIADLIEGVQGESETFYLGDYYISESPIVSVKFKSDSVMVESLEGDSFRVNQPENKRGNFIIDGVLLNEDNYELESELTYKVELDPNIPPSEGILVIMPLGDSLTNDSRPRVTLWNLLTNDGHELNYVGDQRQSSSIPDDQHEGVGGIKIQGIADKAERLMNTHKPEYIMLMVGTNDIVWYFNETGEEIAARWNDLVQLLFDSSASGTYIVAATIPPVTSRIVGESNLDERDRAEVVKIYNSEIRKYVESRREKGENIILADVEDALTISEHLSNDEVHLNREGYEKMGTVYYEAMNSVLWEQYNNSN